MKKSARKAVIYGRLGFAYSEQKKPALAVPLPAGPILEEQGLDNQKEPLLYPSAPLSLLIASLNLKTAQLHKKEAVHDLFTEELGHPVFYLEKLIALGHLIIAGPGEVGLYHLYNPGRPLAEDDHFEH